jgi:hypothetical protein
LSASRVNADGSVGQAPEPGSLVLDGQRWTKRARGWCERGPEHLRLVTSEGFVRPRCKRRDCPRCWAIRSRETARCLLLDARADCPTHVATFTTVDPLTSPETFRIAMKNVARRLRRHVGRMEYFGSVEFTTGEAPTSGGHRRQHVHALLKFRDVAAAELDVVECERLAAESWERTTGAWRAEIAALVSPGASIAYLGLHHRKASQAPPAAWRGMTERASLRYWSTPIAELRVRARAELAAEAHAWRTGMPVEMAALEVAARDAPRLIEVKRLGDATVVEPMGEVRR